jgi:hypothetical protein
MIINDDDIEYYKKKIKEKIAMSFNLKDDDIELKTKYIYKIIIFETELDNLVDEIFEIFEE